MQVDQLYQLYYTKHAMVRTRCPENVHYFWSAHSHQWTGKDIANITKREVQDWVDDLAAASKSSATRAVNQLAAIFGWGIKRGYIDSNPCIGVERFSIKPRERFLMPGELAAFFDSLMKEEPTLRDFFLICLLTGARRGNVLAMQWKEIDLDLLIWRFDAKNDDLHTLPLCKSAAQILFARKALSTSQYVFPGRYGGHLREPKRAWARVLSRAGIENLRIHDLRRTVGSYLAIKGASPYVIGKALGHRDQRSTAVYARLDLEPVRGAMEGVEEILLGSKSEYPHRIISPAPGQGHKLYSTG